MLRRSALFVPVVVLSVVCVPGLIGSAPAQSISGELGLSSRAAGSARGSGGRGAGVTLARRGISSRDATPARAPAGEEPIAPRRAGTLPYTGLELVGDGSAVFVGEGLPVVYGFGAPYWYREPHDGRWGLQVRKPYGPPVAHELRLGLHYNYPFAWHAGLTLPVDADPLVVQRLEPFRGVVRSSQAPGGDGGSAGFSGVAELMRAGDFRAAGRLLADGYRTSDDPRYPLWLAEVLFAHEKYAQADRVLGDALGRDGAFERLPDDVASHFPSRDDFEKRLAALRDDGGAPLLSAYLHVFSKEPSDGLEMLVALEKDESLADIATRLYRRYLGRAFAAGDDENEPPEDASEAPGGEN